MFIARGALARRRAGSAGEAIRGVAGGRGVVLSIFKLKKVIAHISYLNLLAK
jgi:hypothetical protein